MKAVFFVIFLTLALLALGVYLFTEKPQEISEYITSKITIMTISSPAFENNKFIPETYTCDSKDINPQLDIHDAPKNAKSLALIITDPDAPSGNFTHWIIWNIEPMTKTIEQQSLPQGAIEGVNSAGRTGYLGPCPPSGTHRYIFKLYALDTILNLSPDATRSKFEQAINGHILTTAELTGLYGRTK